MAATYNDIKGWLLRAKAEGATHVLSVCDTFSYDDYPVFVMPGEDVEQKIAAVDAQPMQHVQEVYNLALDIDAQLNERWTWNVGMML